MSTAAVIEFEPDFDLELDEDQEIDVPNLWKVILHNDDYTPMDFVVQVLTEIFNMDTPGAVDLMSTIHEEGAGVAGVYTHEIAEEKAMHTMGAARHSGFPLRATIEEDE